jgi:hypothetical protein
MFIGRGYLVGAKVIASALRAFARIKLSPGASFALRVLYLRFALLGGSRCALLFGIWGFCASRIQYRASHFRRFAAFLEHRVAQREHRVTQSFLVAILSLRSFAIAHR